MKHSLPLIVALSLAACGDSDSPPVPEPPPVESEPVDMSQIVSGVQAYEQICANCHETGVNGAPRTGHPEDWAERSPLWEAVLFEHATAGWRDMPAKGGVEELNDQVVMRAAEHMLSITFPDTKTTPELP